MSFNHLAAHTYFCCRIYEIPREKWDAAHTPGRGASHSLGNLPLKKWHNREVGELFEEYSDVALSWPQWSRSVMSDSLQSVDCSPPSFSVHGILQARIQVWVAISFPGDLPDPGIEPRSPTLEADALTCALPGKPLNTRIQSLRKPPIETQNFRSNY